MKELFRKKFAKSRKSFRSKARNTRKVRGGGGCFSGLCSGNKTTGIATGIPINVNAELRKLNMQAEMNNISRKLSRTNSPNKANLEKRYAELNAKRKAGLTIREKANENARNKALQNAISNIDK